MREFEETDPHTDVAVTFVTIGLQEKADAFCKEHGATARCIGDEDKRTYRAMGLTDFGFIGFLVNGDLKKRRVENNAAGFSQNWGATKLRDAKQNPGAAAIDADGVVRWIYRGVHPGDLPSMREMLTQARGVFSASSI